MSIYEFLMKQSKTYKKKFKMQPTNYADDLNFELAIHVNDSQFLSTKPSLLLEIIT
jgi:hypothetical protein